MINIYRDKMAQIYKKWGYGSDVLTENMAEFSYFLKKNIESMLFCLVYQKYI